MKTTLNIPDELIEKARRVSGKKTKTETVVTALEELVRKKKLEKVLNQAGKLKFNEGKKARHAR
jgi:Arc/MetJ family transcription regulator